MKITCGVALLVCVISGFYLWRHPIVILSRPTSEFDSISASLKTYKINADRYPSTEQGLAALITRPTTEPLPKKWIQVLRKLPPDPWDCEYHYRALPEGDERGFEIRSAGKDGVLGTKDDISSLDD
ncbi:type II secretion system protein GspG [Haloferula sp. BvORR071]|uniref:type II secretion system protein GspG n=1 Tax=Haloferula sp. BvORR071 TaxID=1396141 RepID=UPI000696620C|nr:type II secretion system protein GspG [Haloferula sp. BvORR071]